MEMHILIWIIVGILAGWLTGLVMKGRGYGLLGDLVIGLLGGLIGGWLFGLVGLAPTSWLGQVLVSFIGGVVLVAIARLLRRA
jgi:uncharacterized membrane protein YeaQ/YmgE (transglycosylase-associated protein family)